MIKHFVGMFSLIFNVLCCFAVPLSYRVIDVGPTFDGWEWYDIFDEFPATDSDEGWAAYGNDLLFSVGGGVVTFGNLTGNPWTSDYVGDWWRGGRLTRGGDTNNWIELVPWCVGNGMITGRVVSDGAAVSGAVMRAFLDRGGYCEPVGAGDAVVSGSDGVYSFSGLESGDYWVFCVLGNPDGTYFDRPYTGGVVRVEGAVSSVDFVVKNDCSLSGRLVGLWGIPGTNVTVNLWRRSADKQWTEAVYPPGYDPLMPDLGVGYIPPQLIKDGAWWWCCTSVTLPLSDSAGNFYVDGLEAGWYLARFDGGNLSAPFEVEYHVTGDFQSHVISVALAGVSLENPPSGVCMFTKLRPELALNRFTYSFVTGSTNHFYRLMTSTDLSRWYSLGSIIKGTDSGKENVVGVSAGFAAVPTRYFKLVRFVP